MATERIEIIVTESGTDVVVKKIDSIGSSARGSSDSIDLLQTALAGLGAAATLQGLSGFLDTLQNAQNRLLYVSSSQEEATYTMQALQAQADSTRQSFEQTVDLYARVALATQALGISHADAARVVQTLQEAITLSGASTREANSALVQFTQGLAAGTLRGRELRSLMQEIPAVADIIATKLGVTRGALRDLGTQGKVSADLMVHALLDASGQIDAKFGKTIPTIGQAFVVLQNHVLEFLNTLNSKYDIIGKVDAAIQFLGDHMDVIGRVVLAGTLVAGAAAAAGALDALTAALLANPIGLIVLAIGAAVALLVVFSDKIKLSSGSLTTLGDFGKAVFESLRDNVKFLSDEFVEFLNFITPLFQKVFGTDFDFSIKGMLTLAAKAYDGLIGIAAGAGAVIASLFEDIPATIEAALVLAANGIITAIQGMVNSVIYALNYLSNTTVGKQIGLGVISDIELTKVQGSAAAKAAGKDIGEAFQIGFNSAPKPAKDLLDDLTKRADQIAQQRIAKQELAQKQSSVGAAQFNTDSPVDTTKENSEQIAVDGVINKLKEEAKALELTNIQRAVANDLIKIQSQLSSKGDVITQSDKDRITAQETINEQLKERAQLTQAVQGADEKRAVQEAALNEIILAGGKYTDQYIAELNKLKIADDDASRDLGKGFQSGFLTIQNTISDFSKQSKDLVVNTFNSMEDALTKFVTTGKVNFSDLANSILASLTKILLNQAIVALLGAIGGPASGLGSLLGGVATGTTSAATSHALGGSVDPGKSYLVGEHGPEVFTPGSGGQIAPNGGNAGSSKPEIHVHVVNVSDPNEISSALAQPNNQALIVNAVGRNPRAVKQALGIGG